MSKFQRDDNPRRPAPLTSEILDRKLPYDLDAEMGVLGSMMLKPDVMDDIALLLRPGDFYDDANRKLFEQMLAMHDSGKKIDITLLVDRLRVTGDLDIIGGTAYLAKVFQSVPHAAHAVFYGNIVRDKAVFRSMNLR